MTSSRTLAFRLIFQRFMQVSKELNFFTVYLTAQCIEVCPGCKDYPDWYALHTSKSYESAEQFAQAVAIHRSLPIRNWLRPEG